MKTLRKRLCILIAALVLLASFPAAVTAGPLTFAGYDEHDVQRLLAFASRQTYEDRFDLPYEIPLEKLNWSVDVTPDAWDYVTWTEADGVKYLETLNTGAKFGTVFEDEPLAAGFSAMRLSGNLNLSGCKWLKEVRLYDAPVDSVNVSGCEKLGVFTLTLTDKLWYEPFLQLPVSRIRLDGCVSLQFLEVFRTEHLKKIDLSDCRALQEIHCEKNDGLQGLDLSECENLEWVDFYDNSDFAFLKVAGLKRLENLSFVNCKISSIDLSGLESLETLYCDGNGLTALDLKDSTKLRVLSCVGNGLTELDLSNCRELDLWLDVSVNKLTKLTFDAPKLSRFYCSQNQLKELDVSNCPLLEDFECSDNQLKTLDVSNCPELMYLECADNRLTKLDVSKSPKLQLLDCSNNPISRLDLTNNTNLLELEYNGTNIKSGYDLIGFRERDDSFFDDAPPR